MKFTELPSFQFFMCAEDQCLLQSIFVQLTGKDLKKRKKWSQMIFVRRLRYTLKSVCSTEKIARILAIEHGVLLALRHLKRLLRELGLFRRKNYRDIRDVVDFIHEQIQTSGKLHGYRWMH